MNKSISLVSPIFTNAELLRKMLDSILSQSVLPDEVVLVVDSLESQDVLDVLANFSKQFKNRLVIEHNDEPLGITRTTWRAMELAKGAYVALVDSDDELVPNAIELIRSEITPETTIISSRFEYIDDRGNYLGELLREEPRRLRNITQNDWRAEIATDNRISHLKLINRNLAMQISVNQRFDGVQDAILNFELTSKGAPKLLDNVLYRHRVHGNQYSNYMSAIQYKELNDARFRWIHKVYSRHPYERTKFESELLHFLKSNRGLQSSHGDLFVFDFSKSKSLELKTRFSSIDKVRDLEQLKGKHLVLKFQGQVDDFGRQIPILLGLDLASLNLFMASDKQDAWDLVRKWNGVFDSIVFMDELPMTVLAPSISTYVNTYSLSRMN